jgi:hypothetical protein
MRSSRSASGTPPRTAEHLLEREHRLDDGTKLGAFGWIAPGVVLVGAEHAVRLTVELVEDVERLQDGVAIDRVARDERPDGRRLERHGVVDAVRAHRPIGELRVGRPEREDRAWTSCSRTRNARSALAQSSPWLCSVRASVSSRGSAVRL